MFLKFDEWRKKVLFLKYYKPYIKRSIFSFFVILLTIASAALQVLNGRVLSGRLKSKT